MDKCMVQLVDIVKSFGTQTAVDNVNVEVRKGEFLTLLGPSGCGKTTTLRMIAGFEEPTSGKVYLDGQNVSEKQPYQRDVNTVFQSYALFPHMNIFDNVAFGLTIKKVPKAEIKEKVLNAIKLVRLEGYEKRFPSQLSGGQKQRVAMARALVNNPKVLLLDEPLGALDLKLRKQMQFELKHLQKQLGITFIYVTHDQEEALTMSDRIAVMNKGKIEQIGVPDEIYERPRTKFVADFIGETNMFEGQITGINGDEANITVEDGVNLNIKDIQIKQGKIQNEDNVIIAIRPERIRLNLNEDENSNNVKVKIKERIYVGSVNKTVVLLKNGREVTVNEPASNTLSIPQGVKDVYISWKYEDTVVIA